MSAPLPEDVSETLKQLAISLVENAQGRFDLLRVEMAEERGRIGSFLYHGAALCFLAFLTLELFVLTVVGYYWDGPYRLHVVFLMLGFSILATCVMWAAIRRGSAGKVEVWEQMADEFKKDVAAIESIG